MVRSFTPSQQKRGPTHARLRARTDTRTHAHRYDCCLINWYPDGESACKWHSDPEHGAKWSLDECVVSFGEVRRFNLKRISLPPKGGVWGGKVSLSSAEKRSLMSDEGEHSFHVFHGDVVHMFRDCQDKYLHCVKKGEGPHNVGPRISIVFKASLLSASGTRGHGLAQSPKGKGQCGAATQTKFKLPPKNRKRKTRLVVDALDARPAGKGPRPKKDVGGARGRTERG